ncbi:MAG: three-Cys-motif partner protein TcmP [Sedimentisphaerales bacterium]
MNQFGGVHTIDKQYRLGLYLAAFTTFMKDKPFQLMYVDAFAGSGSHSPIHRNTKNNIQGFFPKPAPQVFDGSARLALQVKPKFDKYIFIDNKPNNTAQLSRLQDEYPDDNIKVKNDDANIYLKKLCKKCDWTHWRAVLFLDPYGMQVNWTTIEAVAQTHAIDLWCLFPLGVAVNRLLRRDGRINKTSRYKLDEVLGSHDWYGVFYKTKTGQNLFGEYTKIIKIAKPNQVGEYYLNQLRSVFAGVARRPLRLYNKSTLLYWLYFAAGDQNGATRRISIAENILASLSVRQGLKHS